MGVYVYATDNYNEAYALADFTIAKAPIGSDAVAGSVVVTLKPSFLETLAAGEHTLTALFDDADPAETRFTVADAPAPAPTPGDGGDSSGANASPAPGNASGTGSAATPTGSSGSATPTATAAPKAASTGSSTTAKAGSTLAKTADPLVPAIPVMLILMTLAGTALVLRMSHLRSGRN